MTAKQTSKKLTLSVQKRQLTGKKVKKLRKQGLIPATVYGKGFTSISIQLPQAALKTLRSAGETQVIYMTLDKKHLPVMIRQVQYHPVTDQVLHIDFYKVDLKEKVTAPVPIELTGEAPIVKQGYNIVQVLHEIEVSALPTEIPESIPVDISHLTEEGQDIRVKDLKIKEAISFTDVDPEETIVIIEKAKEEVEEEAVEETPTEEAAPDTAEQTPDSPDAKPKEEAK
ncbi:MAG: 50S ribosomal protein L25 [bacterium]|nr:50S ribosomal protein L25 [bacterium]